MTSSIYAIVGLGANLGDRQSMMAEALERLHWELGPVLKLAPVFETEPYGGVADQPFLNSAALVQTHLIPEKILSSLQAIEGALGRVRTKKWENRIIDLDILLMSRDRHGAELIVTDEPGLTVPHPELMDRDFALVPAARVCPEWLFTDGVSLDRHVKDRGFQLPRSEPWPRLRIHAGENASLLHEASVHRPKPS